MKPVSARTAKRRLLQLADLLETVPPENFDFSTFGEVLQGENGQDALKNATMCGTKACALGWAPSLTFAKRLGFKLKVVGGWYPSTSFTQNDKRVPAETVCKTLFGLTWKTGRFIFDTSELHGDSGETTEDVAKAIRTFVAIRFG